MKTLEDFIVDESQPILSMDAELPETKTVAAPSEGFVIKEIEMKGFMRYVEKTSPPITFPHKFTVITGKTGTGKTSILDAITFTLYKRTSRTDIQGIKISDICRPGGFVRVSFCQSGEEYEVTRGFTSSKSPYLTLKRNGKSIEGKIKDLEKAVEDVIGLDYDGFRNSTFVRQEEMKELGAESAARRLNIFQKLFRLETFEKAQMKAERRYSEIQGQIKTKEGELKVEKKHAQRLPELEKALEELKKKLSGKTKEQEELRTVLEEKIKALSDLEKEHEEFLKIQTRLKEAERNLGDIDSKLEKSRKQASEFSQWKKRVEELRKKTGDIPKLKVQLESLKEQKNRRTRVSDKLNMFIEQDGALEEKYKQTRMELENQLKKQEDRILKLKTEVDREEAFGLLRDQGGLSERIARIDLELGWLGEREDLAADLKKQQKRAKSALVRIDKRVSDINADSFILSEIKDRVNSIKLRFSETESSHNLERESIKKKRENLEREIREIGFGKKEERKLLELKESLQVKEEQKQELDRIRLKMDETGDISRLIQELTLQKEDKGKERSKLENEFLKLQDVEKDYIKIRREIETIKGTEKDQGREIGRLTGRIGSMKEQISHLAAGSERITELEKELAQHREKAEIYELLKNRIFHKRGIVMYAIDQLLPQLSLETSTNLSHMTDGRFSKARLTSYGENNRYGIRIEVLGAEGRWYDVQEFSGGEKTQINAALRFAIAKELASMPQVGRTYGRMKTLFIDEGDLGSLDSESSRQLFVAKLFSMGEFFEKIILITHLSEVAERFPGRLMVYMTPEEESRIKVMA